MELDYNSVIAITQSMKFLVALGIVWFLPLLVYLLIGAFRVVSKKSKKRMIQTWSFWMGWLLWFILQGALFIFLIIYPFWLKL